MPVDKERRSDNEGTVEVLIGVDMKPVTNESLSHLPLCLQHENISWVRYALLVCWGMYWTYSNPILFPVCVHHCLSISYAETVQCWWCQEGAGLWMFSFVSTESLIYRFFLFICIFSSDHSSKCPVWPGTRLHFFFCIAVLYCIFHIAAIEKELCVRWMCCIKQSILLYALEAEWSCCCCCWTK